MKLNRFHWLAFAILALVPVIAMATITEERDQIGVDIIVNVTPAPVGLAAPPPQSPAQSSIVARLTLRNANPALHRAFEAQSLHFESGPQVIAQSQEAVKVEAEVSPNPNATLLYSNQTDVEISAVAGSSVTISCAYNVTVDTTEKSWDLDHGLGSDFDGSTFPGKDLSNNSYLSTPLPKSTPFDVYADDNGAWALLAAGSLEETFCVDLTVTVPASVPAGMYSSNAIYTLYY